MKALTEKQAHDCQEILLYIDNTFDFYKAKFNAFVDCAAGDITRQQLENKMRALVRTVAALYLSRVALITLQYARAEIMAEFDAENALGNYNTKKVN